MASYYNGSPGPMADGTRFSHSGMFCAVSRYGPFHLGQQLLVYSPKLHRSVHVTARDYTAKRIRNRVDLCPKAARVLMGPRYKIIGVIKVKVT